MNSRQTATKASHASSFAGTAAWLVLLALVFGVFALSPATGAEYGTVQDVFETGANNVYRIVNGAGEEFLFPAVDAMIAKTDIENGKLFVKPIPGIFGDGAETVPVSAGEAADAD